jgi:hypothetical protein
MPLLLILALFAAAALVPIPYLLLWSAEISPGAGQTDGGA